jgi:2-polyprenyl-6-methoxyphenol hydroxylase-like FAD-dependent oxidoreductase
MSSTDFYIRTFFFYISWHSSLEQQDEERKTFGNKERLAQVKEKSKRYCEPWKSAFEWVPEDQAAWYFDLAVWDPSLKEHKWDNKNGRVTLAGDAAHPMTYRSYQCTPQSRSLLITRRARTGSEPLCR